MSEALTGSSITGASGAVVPVPCRTVNLVLTCTFPTGVAPVASGWVIIQGQDPAVEPVSDLLHFIGMPNAPGQAVSFEFWSDPDGDGDAADQGNGIPAVPVGANVVQVREEAMGTANYTASGAGATNTIVIQSDCSSSGFCTVPEPGPGVLLLGGGLGVLAGRRLMRRTR